MIGFLKLYAYKLAALIGQELDENGVSHEPFARFYPCSRVIHRENLAFHVESGTDAVFNKCYF